MKCMWNNQISTQKESGFSLVELMVSVVVFMIFMGSVYGLMKIGTIQKTSATIQTDVIKNARLSLNTIGRDAVNAGFGYSRVGGYVPDNVLNLRIGSPADAGPEHDLITAIITGNDLNPNSLLTTGNTDVMSFLYRNMDFNLGQPVRIVSAANFSSSGVVLTTMPGEAVNIRQFDLFLVSDGTRTALAIVTGPPVGDVVKFQIGAADPLGINAPYSGTVNTRSKLVACDPGASPPLVNECMDYSLRVTAKKINWVKYYVALDGTLMRVTFANNTGAVAADQIQTQPIAFNVQNFQVKYLLRDGSVTDDPSAGGTTQSKLNDVVQADVTITARVQAEENGVTVDNIVQIKSTFSTKNLSYDNS